MLARATDCMGYHDAGLVAVCAWESHLWWEDVDKHWWSEHADVLELLGVESWKVGRRWVSLWTEDQARAFQLIHVFLHELGHHHDAMTTGSGRRPARGEAYAEAFALELQELVWDDFVRAFAL